MPRKVKYLDGYNPTFNAKIYGLEDDYTCGTWINKDVKIFWNGETADRDITFKWSKDNVDSIVNSSSFIVNESGLYEGKYEWKSKLSGINLGDEYITKIREFLEQNAISGPAL